MDEFEILLLACALGAIVVAVMVVRDYRSIKQELGQRRAVPQRVRQRPISIVSRIEGAKKCSICLGVIKRDLRGIECSCGSNFHQSCAMRVGVCPICGEEIQMPPFIPKNPVDSGIEPVRSMPLSNVDRLFLLEDRLLSGEIDQDSYQRLKTEILTTMPEPVFCANCGGKLYPGEKCQCTKEDSTRCPECGIEIAQDERFCRACGIIFADDFSEELYQCSACGRIVSASERICSCGAALLDPGDLICPECGHPVPPLSNACPNCGRLRMVEQLECPSCGRGIGAEDFECECGAIFEDRIERIECPECAAEVGLTDQFCKSCGVQFRKNGFSSFHKSI